MRLLTAIFFGLLVAVHARAERVLMEGKPSTGSSLTVSSNSVQVLIATNTLYGGTVPNVGLYTTSNVAVGLSGCILYSTGSLSCASVSVSNGVFLPDGTVIYSTTQFSGSSGSFTGGTVPNATNFSSDVYINGGIGLTVQSNISAPSITLVPQASSPTATQGKLYFDSTRNQIMLSADGTSWVSLSTGPGFGPPPLSCAGIGGSSVIIGGYCIHTFTTNDTFTISSATVINILLVGGGGGGGTNGGGGGGAGDVIISTISIVGTNSVIIGFGGAGALGGSASNGVDGENTVFSSFTANGGGGGGSLQSASANGSPGASGGGSSPGLYSSVSGGSGTVGQGNNGGSSGLAFTGGGGGGGAGNPGADGLATSGGNGGDGISSSLSGALVYYGGGGGSATYINVPASGGNGGGGNGGATTGNNGVDGTGGGGGGSGYYGYPGGAGGTGIVIISYPAF